MLRLDTGGGKTHIFSNFMKKASERGARSMMVVRGRQLVDQASQRLFAESVPHGVMMSNHWNKNARARTQVCSIDTLLSRQEFPETDLLIIDEAHLFTSPGCIEFMSYYEDTYSLAVTATPFTDKSLRHMAEEVVYPITTRELIEQGYLVNARYFSPSLPDLRGVRTQSGDWQNEQLKERMETLTGDIVEHWKRLGENRPTLGFAVNIRHGEDLAERCRREGIPSEFLEGNHSFEQRKQAVERLRTGETKILWNVGVFCTGVDIPFLGCIISARPTKSYNLFKQQLGRGTRIFPGKTDFIVLDHAGNVLRHGFITDEREVNLDGFQRTKILGEIASRCLTCYSVFARGSYCANCGPNIVPENERDFVPLSSDGELEEMKQMPVAAAVLQTFNILKKKQKTHGHSRWWLRKEMEKIYGEEVAETFVPQKRNGRFNAAPWLNR